MYANLFFTFYMLYLIRAWISTGAKGAWHPLNFWTIMSGTRVFGQFYYIMLCLTLKICGFTNDWHPLFQIPNSSPACCRAFLLSWNSNFLTFLGFIQLSSKRNQAPWDGGQIPYFHYKGSSIKIKGSYQKFYKKGSSTKRRGFTLWGGHFFCFGGQIPYCHYKGSSTKRRGFTLWGGHFFLFWGSDSIFSLQGVKHQ